MLKITLHDLIPSPATTDLIRESLQAIQGGGMIRGIIRNGATSDLTATIQMIKDQCRDGHRVAIVDIIGERALVLIDSI